MNGWGWHGGDRGSRDRRGSCGRRGTILGLVVGSLANQPHQVAQPQPQVVVVQANPQRYLELEIERERAKARTLELELELRYLEQGLY